MNDFDEYFADIDRPVSEEEVTAAAASPFEPDLPPAELPIDYWIVSGVERAAVFRELAEFVHYLVVSYALDEREVPRCWYLHNALVQELLALMQYRKQVYSEAAPPSAPQDFHFQLQQTLLRMRSWAARTNCIAAEHNPDYIPPWVKRVGKPGDGFYRQLSEFTKRVTHFMKGVDDV